MANAFDGGFDFRHKGGPETGADLAVVPDVVLIFRRRLFVKTIGEHVNGRSLRQVPKLDVILPRPAPSQLCPPQSRGAGDRFLATRLCSIADNRCRPNCPRVSRRVVRAPQRAAPGLPAEFVQMWRSLGKGYLGHACAASLRANTPVLQFTLHGSTIQDPKILRHRPARFPITPDEMNVCRCCGGRMNVCSLYNPNVCADCETLTLDDSPSTLPGLTQANPISHAFPQPAPSASSGFRLEYTAALSPVH